MSFDKKRSREEEYNRDSATKVSRHADGETHYLKSGKSEKECGISARHHEYKGQRLSDSEVLRRTILPSRGSRPKIAYARGPPSESDSGFDSVWQTRACSDDSYKIVDIGSLPWASIIPRKVLAHARCISLIV